MGEEGPALEHIPKKPEERHPDRHAPTDSRSPCPDGGIHPRPRRDRLRPVSVPSARARCALEPAFAVSGAFALLASGFLVIFNKTIVIFAMAPVVSAFACPAVTAAAPHIAGDGEAPSAPPRLEQDAFEPLAD